MLSDPAHKVIDAYGLHDPAYDGTKFDGIPHPTVYVIDKNGRVAWAKVETDYKVRPSNTDIRAALESLIKDHAIMKRQILSLLSDLMILCFAASLYTVHAQTTPPKITTKLSLSTTKVQRGRSVRASLVLDIPRGYHVNAHDPVSRFALPTKIEVEAPSGIRIGSISYPGAIVRRFTFSEDRLGVYENRAVISFKIMIPPINGLERTR